MRETGAGMDRDFEEYIKERDSDPGFRKAHRDYYGDGDRIRHVTRQRPGIFMGDKRDGRKWIKVRPHE